MEDLAWKVTEVVLALLVLGITYSFIADIVRS